MAVNVDTVYQRVLALANKEQRGYITPQEFNLFANHAQLEIVEQYFYDINQFGRLPGNNTEYSDMLDLLNEKLGALKRNNQSVLATSGVITHSNMPDDIYKIGTITFGGNEVERVEYNELVQLSSSPLTAPTNKRPLYTEGSNGITLYPPISSVKMSYIKKPNNVKWGYVVVGEKALYDPSKSTHFSLHKSEESELVYKILMLAGITMNKIGLSQTVVGMENAKIQQEKQ